MRVSFFKSALYNPVKTPVLPPYKNLDMLEIFHHIQNGGFKKILEKYYTKQIVKQLLPCFTPAGTFTGRENNGANLLECYSKVMHLDFDKVENLYELKEAIKKDKYTFAYFKSPSMNGLKVFVKVDSESQWHKTAFYQVRKHYYNVTGLLSDKKCKDITRLCFVSSDQSLFLNEKSSVFPIDIKLPEPVEVGPAPERYEFGSTEQYLVDFTGRKSGPYPSDGRNEWLFRLACNCNRYGLGKTEALTICRTVLYSGDMTGFSENELNTLVRSAYNNRAEHAKYNFPKTVKY